MSKGKDNVIVGETGEIYELVQVYVNGDKAEITVRNKNGFRAFGGVLKEMENPRSVYPPGYFE